MTAAKSFASVKLPESLVQQARDAAQPLCRSAAGQIEYWVTLGRVVKHSGLTAQKRRKRGRRLSVMKRPPVRRG